jgi:hypothetical protein
MEGVTFNPLAAVEKTTKQTRRRVDRNAQCPFYGMHCAHLIGDRTNAADASRDVGSFGEVPTAQEGLKETRRFVDLQLNLGYALTHEFYVK